MKELIGKRIGTISINPEKTIIMFHTSDGEIAYEAEGDCCSESWFNNISNLDALRGGYHLITDVIKREETQAQTGEMRQEETSVYGYDLVTPKGTCYIEMRNSSNGYYGGSLRLTASVNKAEMKQVVEDF